MIKVKELIARLEMIVTSCGEECEVGTFSDVLFITDEKGNDIQQIEI